MKKFKILTKPTSIDALKTNDWYEDFNDSLELKLDRIRSRQRRIKNGR